jgi:hypothetical protein
MALTCCNLQPFLLVKLYARLVVDAAYTFNKDDTVNLCPFHSKQAGGKIGSATMHELKTAVSLRRARLISAPTRAQN